MIYCFIIRHKAFHPFKESQLVFNTLIVVTSIEILTAFIIKVAIMPELTHSNFFALIIAETTIELITIALVSALIFIKGCQIVAFDEFKKSWVNRIDAIIGGASIEIFTTFVIKITVMPILACDTFTYSVGITFIVFSCYITTLYIT